MNAQEIISAIGATPKGTIDALEDGEALGRIGVTDADQEAIEEAHDWAKKYQAIVNAMAKLRGKYTHGEIRTEGMKRMELAGLLNDVPDSELDRVEWQLEQDINAD